LTERKYNEAINSFEKAIEAKPNYYVKAHENMEIAETAISNMRTNNPTKHPQ
jgi:hypothetical protein